MITWAGAGYGDIAPVTNIGRILGMVLVISGVTTWGLLIGNLSAFLSARSAEMIAREGPEPSVGELKRKLSQLDQMTEGELLALQGQVDALIKDRIETRRNKA